MNPPFHGFKGYIFFVPNACLLKAYVPGAKMSPHHDKAVKDFSARIVSTSFGMSTVFLFGTFKRTDRPLRHWLAHGDLVV